MNWQELRFLADENIDDEVIAFLRQEGFDVLSLFDLNLNGKPDIQIIHEATKLNRITITHDTDFGQIVFTQHVPFIGIIYLKPGHFQSFFTINSLKTIFAEQAELMVPFMVIADHKGSHIKLRIRNSITF